MLVRSAKSCNSNNPFIQPDNGKKFISVDVTIENIGSKQQDYNLLFFKLQDDQDFTYTPSIFPCQEPQISSGYLGISQKTRGYITFEIPTESKPQQLIYTISIWGSGQIIINLSNKNSSEINNKTSINEQIAVIDDIDGYTNIRNGPGMDFDVIGKVLTGEEFYVTPNREKQWWLIKTKNGIKGYMHRSKIKLL